MLRLLIVVAVLLLLVYILRSMFHVNAGARRRVIRREAEGGGRTIEGEPPRVRDARETPPREHDQH